MGLSDFPREDTGHRFYAGGVEDSGIWASVDHNLLFDYTAPLAANMKQDKSSTYF